MAGLDKSRSRVLSLPFTPGPQFTPVLHLLAYWIPFPSPRAQTTLQSWSQARPITPGSWNTGQTLMSELCSSQHSGKKGGCRVRNPPSWTGGRQGRSESPGLAPSWSSKPRPLP